MNNLHQGTQIIYVPSHAEGDINHPDCEVGFVYSVSSFNTGSEQDSAYCRYWYKDGTLRTKLNSERTYIRNIVIKDTYPQSKIDQALKDI